MNNIEFLELLTDNLSTYLYILFAISTIYLLILRKYINGLADPMLLCCIAAIFSSTIPVFLYAIGLCKIKMLLYCIFSEVAFWIGFILNYDKQAKFKNYTIKNEERVSFHLYIIFFILFTSLKLISFKYLGIPLLMGNRLEATANAGGLAILNKIANPLQFYCNVYSYHIFRRKKVLSVTCLIAIFLFSFLNGSKSFILTFIFAYFTYSFFYKRTIPIIPKKVLVLIFLTPMITLLASGFSDNLMVSIGDYLFRLVAYGDIYWYSIPNNVIEHISIDSSFKHLFSGILGPLRIMNYDDNAIPLGVKLYWYTMPIEAYGTNGGPNARPVILGYWLYKYGGIVFCYICGLCMSWAMTKFKKLLPSGIIPTIFIGYLYMSTVTIATDPVLAINNIFTVILFISILFITYNLIYDRKIILARFKQSNGTCTSNPLHFSIIIFMLIFITISITFYTLK